MSDRLPPRQAAHCIAILATLSWVFVAMIWIALTHAIQAASASDIACGHYSPAERTACHQEAAQ